MNLLTKATEKILEKRREVDLIEALPLLDMERVCTEIETICNPDNACYVNVTSNGIIMMPYIDDMDKITQCIKKANQLNWFVANRNHSETSIDYILRNKANFFLNEPVNKETGFHPCDYSTPYISVYFTFLDTGKCRAVQVGSKSVPVYEIQCVGEEV